jgi:hypothetical protein
MERSRKITLLEILELRRRANYGLDSPRIMATLFSVGIALLLVGQVTSSTWRWVAYCIGGYFLLGALGMLLYSKVGRLARCRLEGRLKEGEVCGLAFADRTVDVVVELRGP